MNAKNIIQSGLLLLVGAAFGSSSCNKHSQMNTASQPSVLAFVITENGQLLSDTALSAVKCYFMDSTGNKRYTTYSVAGEEYDNPALIQFRNVGTTVPMADIESDYIAGMSQQFNVHTFYLEFPDSSVDTLYVETEYVDDISGSAAASLCACNTPFTLVKYNGNVAPLYNNTPLLYNFAH